MVVCYVKGDELFGKITVLVNVFWERKKQKLIINSFGNLTQFPGIKTWLKEKQYNQNSPLWSGAKDGGCLQEAKPFRIFLNLKRIDVWLKKSTVL